MRETKWTAGPWSVAGRVADCPEYNEHRHIYAAADRARLGGTGCIANVRSSDANAHLIAAAPELYSVLEAVATRLDLERRERGPDAVFPAAAMVDIALATLAKARGEA